MALRSILAAAALAALPGLFQGGFAQTIAPAAPAEAAIEGTLPMAGEEETVQTELIDTAPVAAASIEHVDMIIEGALTSVRTRQAPSDQRQYNLTDIAEALNSKVETKDHLLGYSRFQDSTFMTIDMSDGKVRSNRIVLGKLPDFDVREIADTWIGINAVAVMTGTHVSEDERGLTVLTLDKQLLPQFGLELWVNGSPVETFGNEPRTIGPILLLPLEPIVEALGHRMETGAGTVIIRRTQDQAAIELELATGLITVNGTPRGVTPDMQFAERDNLLLPFSAIETLTGTHIKLAPGTNRVDVRLDDRLDATALPGQEISAEVADTPFTPEALSFEVSDRGPITADFTSHWGGYNSKARIETNGGLQSLSGVQPAWASVDIQSLEGWAGTLGDYNSNYRELAGIGQSRIRGASWRARRPSGTIIAIAAGVPLSGTSVESEEVAVPEFNGFVGGARLISEDQTQDIGIAASISPDGKTGSVVAGGQKAFDFRDNETGLQSAYVAADIGVFSGAESGADIRARASVNYAVSDTVGLMASASYDGAKFLSGAASSDFSGVYDQRIGARTAATGSAYWRSKEPWGVLNQVSVGTRASVSHQSGEVDALTTTLAATISTQIGAEGPAVTATLTRSNEDKAGAASETSNLRVRAMQRFDWGSVTASYVTASANDEEASQQFTGTVSGKTLRKGFEKGASVSLTPSATVNWNGDEADMRAGASLAADAGQLLGERLRLNGRVSALSDFDLEENGTRFYGSMQARYRLSRNLNLTAIYSDDFAGNNDLSIALRGVVTFNEPRRHTLPASGKGILTGRVFLDRNRDGVRQEDEPGIGGVRVSVRGTGLSLRANRDGQFTIQNVQQGLYDVSVNKRSLPLGYMVAESAEPRVTIGDGRRTDVDVPVILSGQVRGAVFVDANANGVADPGEQRLEGQWVRLTPETGGEPMVIQSASFGQYGFENVAPGTYRVEVMVAGTPVAEIIEVHDSAPFVRQPLAVPPVLMGGGSGVDVSAGVEGSA